MHCRHYTPLMQATLYVTGYVFYTSSEKKVLLRYFSLNVIIITLAASNNIAQNPRQCRFNSARVHVKHQFYESSVISSVSCSPSVRNGIPGKEGLFIISVTSGSLADKTGVRVSCQAVYCTLYENNNNNNNMLIEYLGTCRWGSYVWGIYLFFFLDWWSNSGS